MEKEAAQLSRPCLCLLAHEDWALSAIRSGEETSVVV